MNADIKEQVRRVAAARSAVIFVRTSSEHQLVEALKDFLTPMGFVLTRWNAVFGFRRPVIDSKVIAVDEYQGKPIEWDPATINEPFQALSGWFYHLKENMDGPIVHKGTKEIYATAAEVDLTAPGERQKYIQLQKTLIVQGIAPWVVKGSPHETPLVQRMIWEIGCWNKVRSDNLIVLLPPGAELPDELLDIGVTVDDPLPTRDIIRDHIWTSFHGSKGSKRYAQVLHDPDGKLGDHAADSLTGLSANRIRTSLLVSAENAHAEGMDSERFLKLLVEQKAEVLKQSAALELAKPERIENVGGLNGLKKWLNNQAKTFTPEAKALGIQPPKGLLLLGPPGCLHGSSPIHDPVDGSTVTVAERYERGVPFHVTARDFQGQPVRTAAMPPAKFAPAQMARVTLSNGQSFTVTLGHRVLTPHGWVKISSVIETLRQPGCAGVPLATSLDTAPPVPDQSPTVADPSEDLQIVSVELLDVEPYYDFHVPLFNNYWMSGAWHHNSGKSMCAKAAASVFGFPLIRFDMGAVFGGLVGQSESQLRTAIRTLEALAPAVVLVDEIEKGFSGHGGGNLDGGTSARVFGTFLSWMNDRDPNNPLIMMASANDISALPPELLRKGRST